MRTTLVSIATLVLFTTFTQADTLKLPLEDPTISFNNPESWTKEKTDSGYSCESEDQEATIVLETADEADLEELINANVKWLMEEEKVEIDKSSEKKGEVESGALKFSTIAWSGKNEQWGPAIIMLAFTDIGNDQVLMITYWVTEKGEAKHKKDIDAVLDSIKKVEG